MKGQKPVIELTSLESTFVRTLTQEEYDIFMRVCECGGWVWYGGAPPTSDSVWGVYREETCIEARQQGFGYSGGDINKYLDENTKNRQKISVEEFYCMQRITGDVIDRVNKYFKE